MTRLRICTFNVENLFTRFRFNRSLTEDDHKRLIRDGWAAEDIFATRHSDPHTSLVAQALGAVDADIVALQEIEGLDTLKRFNHNHLSDLGYPYAMCIDGNDTRGIDVGILCRLPFLYIRSHQWDERTDRPGEPVFGRDCLEVDVLLPSGRTLTIYVNHFKSIAGNREKTMHRRRLQSERVAEIIRERFGDDPSDGRWIVVGDLNDYLPSDGLSPLLGRPWLENIVDRLPADMRWTHHYAADDEVHQLDYILPSRAIASANLESIPTIERSGLPLRTAHYRGPRFPGVDLDAKASDHCPVAWDFIV
ncbi:MAG: endonuclease/exonuclease/phosphatase family protein [Armatimonadota bacterium]